MSKKGITQVAEIFTIMQQTSYELIKDGVAQYDTVEGEQDILLGKLLESAKDFMKKDFYKITKGK